VPGACMCDEEGVQALSRKKKQQQHESEDARRSRSGGEGTGKRRDKAIVYRLLQRK
jgi:hypothetical protein